MWHTEWWNDIALSFSSCRGYLPRRHKPLISFLSYSWESSGKKGNITQEIYRHPVRENSFVSMPPLSSEKKKKNTTLHSQKWQSRWQDGFYGFLCLPCCWIWAWGQFWWSLCLCVYVLFPTVHRFVLFLELKVLLLVFWHHIFMRLILIH